MKLGKPSNHPHNESKLDATHEPSKNVTTKTRKLPASKVFDLRVVPSEGANEPQGSHNFCATCSTP